MSAIAKAFVAAQKEFGPALKTATNPHFKSKYVGLDGCIEAVLDALNNNGIALIQKTHDCENGVKIETILLHESGEEYSGGILHVPASKFDAQGYGSALTYARRYSLMAACGIAPEDDDGNAASKAPPKKEKVIDTSKAEKELVEVVKQGTDALRKAWSALDADTRDVLKDKLAAWKATAAEWDETNLATQG